MKADQAGTVALHITEQALALAARMAELRRDRKSSRLGSPRFCLSRCFGRISRRDQNATKDGFVLFSTL